MLFKVVFVSVIISFVLGIFLREKVWGRGGGSK